MTRKAPQRPLRLGHRGFMSSAFLIVTLTAAATAFACKLPVFRYALERWPVDSYRMVLFVDQSPSERSPELRKALKRLADSPANVSIEVVDLNQLTDQQRWQFELPGEEAELPWLQVDFPTRNGEERRCWEGTCSPATLTQWLDSPMRQQIGSDLASGTSVVWLMFDGPDGAGNEQVAQRVRIALERAQQEITIPTGVIPAENASQYFLEHPEASLDDVLRSNVPLKVEFTLHRVSRDAADELALRQMVAGLGDTAQQATLVPIFGRGRMLDAIPAAKATEQTILNACQYLVGECSCTVKSQNPGIDLLLNVNWKEKLGKSIVVVDPAQFPGIDSAPNLIAIPPGSTSHPSESNQPIAAGDIQDASRQREAVQREAIPHAPALLDSYFRYPIIVGITLFAIASLWGGVALWRKRVAPQ